MSNPTNESRLNRTVRLSCAALIAVATFAASAHEPAKHATAASTSAASTDHSKMGGMKHFDGMSMTGDVDLDFAANMRMHHQMAVDMARAQIKSGKDQKLVRMARDILTAQTKEIAVLDQWISAHKQGKHASAAKGK